jgi:hypothetical protein
MPVVELFAVVGVPFVREKPAALSRRWRDRQGCHFQRENRLLHKAARDAFPVSPTSVPGAEIHCAGGKAKPWWSARLR